MRRTVRGGDKLNPPVSFDSMNRLPVLRGNDSDCKVFTSCVKVLAIKRPFNIKNGVFKLEICHICDLYVVVPFWVEFEPVNSQNSLAIANSKMFSVCAELDSVYPGLFTIDH
ncbi:MAG: hypothetical protein SGARI_003238, partial [Bacillariaceae sp.]